MKKALLVLSILLTNFSLQSQTLKDFSQEDNATFFGVDYTQTIFVGSSGFNNKEAIATEFPQKWNNLFKKEQKKYNLKKFLKKSNIYYSTDFIDEKNSRITTDDLASRIVENNNDPRLLTTEKAGEIAKSYKLKSDASKFGIIVFAKEYNKLDNYGSYLITIVDLNNGNIVYNTEIQGKAGGFGFRNFWAGSFYKSLKNLSKTYKKDLKKLKK